MTIEIRVDGNKFYIKRDGKKEKRISRWKFNRLIKREKINKLSINRVNVNGGSLKEPFEKFQERKENGGTEFGRRVNVNIVEANQIKIGEGLNVSMRLEIVDEETGKMDDDLYFIDIEMEGFTGNLVDRGVYIPELCRILNQLAFNGELHTKEEEEELRKAMGLVDGVEEKPEEDERAGD